MCPIFTQQPSSLSYLCNLYTAIIVLVLSIQFLQSNHLPCPICVIYTENYLPCPIWPIFTEQPSSLSYLCNMYRATINLVLSVLCMQRNYLLYPICVLYTEKLSYLFYLWIQRNHIPCPICVIYTKQSSSLSYLCSLYGTTIHMVLSVKSVESNYYTLSYLFNM